MEDKELIQAEEIKEVKETPVAAEEITEVADVVQPESNLPAGCVKAY